MKKNTRVQQIATEQLAKEELRKHLKKSVLLPQGLSYEMTLLRTRIKVNNER